MTSTFGVAGVQMAVSAFNDNVERMGAYMTHIRTRFPWVRMVLFSELAPLGPNKDKAERREVVLGFHDDAGFEIVKGVAAGESVVVLGNDELSDGMAIRLESATGPASS